MAEEQYELMDIDKVIDEYKDTKLTITETALLSIAQSLQIIRDETRYIAWMMEQGMDQLDDEESPPINCGFGRKMDS